MQTIKLISCPYIIIFICCFIVFLGKFLFKIDYMNCFRIINKHTCVFKNTNGKLLILPFIMYNIVPLFIAYSVNKISIINDDMINLITIILSILTAMLFTILVMVIDLKNKIESNNNIKASKLRVMRVLIKETYYTVMFEILICVSLLVLSFIYLFTNNTNALISYIIYSLIFLLIFNLFIVLKRIFKIIEEQLQ